MEAFMFTGFSDHMEMDDDLNFINHLPQVNSLDGIFESSLVLPACHNTFNQQEFYNHDLSYKKLAQTSNQHHHNPTIIKHEQPINANNWNNNNNYYCSSKIIDDNYHALTTSLDNYASKTSNMLSFGNPIDEMMVSQEGSIDKQSCIVLNNGKAIQVAKQCKTAFTNLSSQQAKDHIIAERKRREKMNQRFIELSAIIPGLKKMDKASVLGDAIKYVKQLQEQVKTLEEVTKKKTIESAVIVRRCRVLEDDYHNSSTQDEPSSGFFDCSYPEIEVRFSNKDVLIRIHCEKKNGVIEKLITQIEKLQLVVINSSALIFGCVSLDATIIAQMSAEFSMTTKDLVRYLHAALKHLI